MTASNLTTPHGKSGPKNPAWGGRLDELKGYLTDGLSYGLIAVKFGTSRNAISGVVYRLGLNGDQNGTKRRPSASLEARTSAGRIRKKPTTEPRIKIAPAFEATEKTETAADFAPQNPVRLLDLRPWNCRFPLGEPSEMLFCGDPIAQRNYCSGHARLCFKPSAGPKPWVPGRVGG